jgi:hypothetical protein
MTIDTDALRLEWIDPKTLTPNPKNWRKHPANQREILAAILEEVGWAGALLWNEQTGKLIDGHERRDLAISLGLEAVPVLIGRWDEAHEAKTLTWLDYSGKYATADPVKLDNLMREIDTANAALMEMLAEQAEWAGVIPPNFDPVGIDEQGRLDEKAKVCCPECGHEFTP